MPETIPAAQKSQLYMVATPIGNRADITQRAREIFESVDIIACEDTRVTGELLRSYGITTQGKLTSVREHNEREAAAQLIERLGAGLSVAYASDAGTPGLSDPGARLVEAVRAAGFRIVPIPGASAVTALICAAGISETAFIFDGFAPHQGGEREAAFVRYAAEPYCTVLRAPRRTLPYADFGYWQRAHQDIRDDCKNTRERVAIVVS
jgi:16S rRNA (cytidine1402-2'-O)-methyltransferase